MQHDQLLCNARHADTLLILDCFIVPALRHNVPVPIPLKHMPGGKEAVLPLMALISSIHAGLWVSGTIASQSGT